MPTYTTKKRNTELIHNYITIKTGIGERESNKQKKEVEWKGTGGGGGGVKRMSIHKVNDSRSMPALLNKFRRSLSVTT